MVDCSKLAFNRVIFMYYLKYIVTYMSSQTETELSFYEKMGVAGREFIGEQRNLFQDSTQKYLINAGILKKDDYSNIITTSILKDREDLDFELTIGKLYTQYKTSDYPSGYSGVRTEHVDSTILRCYEVLDNIWLHDPVFLRLAIKTLVKQKLVEAYNALPLVNEKKLLGEGAYTLIFTAISVAFSWGAAEFLISALKFNVHRAATAMLVTFIAGVALIITLMENMKNNKLTIAKEIKAYEAWLKLNHLLEDCGLEIGSGARFILEKMAKDDIDVPLIALDLCSLLESKKLGGK